MGRMHRPEFSASSMRWNTENSKCRALHYIRMAKKISEDPSKADRIKKSLCKVCYYVDSSRIGGAVVTSRQCACCDTIVHAGAGSPDPLCHACASKHSLCCHCGGDREMRYRRKEWPEREAETLPETY